MAAALCVSAAPAAASRYAQYGVQDDGWLMYGSGTVDQRIETLQSLGVHLVRLSIRWDQVAPTRPADERDPDDPAYLWAQYGVVLDALHAAKIPAVVTLWGSPRWANGGHAANRLPTHGFGNFAFAASKRFPWIRQWTAWNEPNTRIYSTPVSPKLYTQRVLNPAYALLHQANRANKLAGGVTSPRRTASGMSPLAFMQGMRAAHAKLDAYAQNP
jgi:beta-glucosidase/6-phospho-beta-glucosidase/beta-galactosidase